MSLFQPLSPFLTPIYIFPVSKIQPSPHWILKSSNLQFLLSMDSSVQRPLRVSRMILCFPSHFIPGRGFLKIPLFCWGLMMAFALMGCAAHGNTSHAQPALSEKKLLKQWRHVSKERTMAPSAGGLLTVDRVIDEALNVSPELEMIRQRIAAAGEQIRQADAPFIPGWWPRSGSTAPTTRSMPS